MRARDNPFSSHRIEAVPFIFGDGDGPDRLLARLEALEFRGCIWGPEGSGKTTLLERLARDLAARFVVRGSGWGPERWSCRRRAVAGRR